LRTPPSKLDPPIVGTSPATEKLVRLIGLLSRTDVSVLVTGESGTGKELVARNLHTCGGRSGKPFVAVNCAALNPGVLESELFGHGRGSFTGAVSNHSGLFEQADGGTLFLDEIGELPLFVQAKLLRVLQDGCVRGVGSKRSRPVDVRVLSATNSDLERAVREGTFRKDVVVTYETREALLKYHWPGNVRELHNELERLVALYPDYHDIAPAMLSSRITRRCSDEPFDVRLLNDGPLPQAVGYLEESLLRKTLEQTNWNKSKSARKLGLSRQGLLKKIKRYGIVREKGEPGKSLDLQADGA
jgi:two-component system response regulator HupR/HoxA